VDIHGRLPTVPPDRHYVHNAKVLTFIGQKKIEVILVEAVEEEVAAALADLQ
jgi:hypothetical protein